MLYTLSRNEVERLQDVSRGDLAERDLAELVRRCALAVLNSGIESDDAEALIEQHRDFGIEVQQVNRGLRLELTNAPGLAFVDGRIIEGIRELLSSVIRDLVYFDSEISGHPFHDLSTSSGITSAVFEMLRNASALVPEVEPNLVVCWGGHSIGRSEYEYPMKGATIAHAKQRVKAGRYVGISEPGIIAAGADERRDHCPRQTTRQSGALRRHFRTRHHRRGVAEPDRQGTGHHAGHRKAARGVRPAGPRHRRVPGRGRHGRGNPLPAGGSAEPGQCGNPLSAGVHRAAGRCHLFRTDRPVYRLQEVRKYRIKTNDAFYFNWLLKIEEGFQIPFEPTHENMRSLDLRRDVPLHELAANLRRMFSGIVAGNVKPEGLQAIREQGPFEIRCESAIAESLDALLTSFVSDNRMKLPGGKAYEPCYRLIA
jgi:hypothetical protein